MKSSRDAESPIYYKNIPKTCGTCHTQIYEQFIQSRHYKNLQADQLAPTCTTCHGFQMDIQRVQPLYLAERCPICHNVQGVRPDVAVLARETLTEIVRTENFMKKVELMLELGRQSGIELAAADDLLKNARARLDKSAAFWHQFNLVAFRKELREIQTIVGQAYDTARSAILRE